MNIINWTNLLPFLGCLTALISLFNFSKKPVIKKIILIGLGIGVLVVSIINNNKQLRSKKLIQTQADTIQRTIKNLETTTSMVSKKIDTISSLSDYINKLASIGIKRDTITNEPIVTKKFITYINKVDNLYQN